MTDTALKKSAKLKYDDLRFALEAQQPVSIVAITNAISRFCRGRDIGDNGLFALMGEIFRIFGSDHINQKGIRNLMLLEQINVKSKEYDSHQAAYRHLPTELSLASIARIHQGRFSGLHLAHFVYETKAGYRPSPSAIHAAQKALPRIRRQLLSNTGKGRQAREKIFGTGFRDIGNSELHGEIASDVERLILDGLSAKNSYDIVAIHSGETVENIKKICQRIKSKQLQDVEDVAKAASVWPIDINRAIKARDLTGYVKK
jgi:hypothetical protein